MKMRLGLLLLIGLPGSGKTTLAKTLINFQNEKNYQFLHVCYDDLIPFQDHNQEEWKLVRKSLMEKIENLIVAIKKKNNKLCPAEFLCQFDSIKSWDTNIVIILDDNMYLKSMRYSFFQVARKYNLGFCQAHLCCSLENALLSNSKRQAECIVPPFVIENMNDKMEPPNPLNKWEIYSVSLNPFCCNLNDELYSVLSDSLDNFVKERVDESEQKELSKLQCKQSVLHQVDIAMRKIIGYKMKKFIEDNPKQSSKEFITNLNLRKSQILSDIKTGNISLPDEILEAVTGEETENFELINLLGAYF